MPPLCVQHEVQHTFEGLVEAPGTSPQPGRPPIRPGFQQRSMLGLQMVSKARATGKVGRMVARFSTRQTPPPTGFAAGSACFPTQSVFLVERRHDVQNLEANKGYSWNNDKKEVNDPVISPSKPHDHHRLLRPPHLHILMAGDIAYR